MDRSERKAAVSAYKERKPVAGVYAVRCVATDEQWVGAAPDLSTIWTRRAFALRQGSETNPALQSAWNLHGPESFAFKILEEIDQAARIRTAAAAHHFSIEQLKPPRRSACIAKPHPAAIEPRTKTCL